MRGDVCNRADGKTCEDIKRVNGHGPEYWNARAFQPLLGHGQWRSSENAVANAATACHQSDNDSSHHFASAGKMIDLGKGGMREEGGYTLSRFACYLIGNRRLSYWF